MALFAAIGLPGNVVAISQSANPIWVRVIRYKWTLQQSLTPSAQTVPLGATGALGTDLKVTRTAFSIADEEEDPRNRKAVKGEVCLSNFGDRTLRDIRLGVSLQERTGEEWRPLPGAAQTLVIERLRPRKQACVPYDIASEQLVASEGSFRVVTQGPLGLTAIDTIPFPDHPNFSIEIDPTATLTIKGFFQGITGFVPGKTVSSSNSTTVSGNLEMAGQLGLQKASASCGQSASVTSDATLVTDTTNTTLTAHSAVMYMSQSCGL